MARRGGRSRGRSRGRSSSKGRSSSRGKSRGGSKSSSKGRSSSKSSKGRSGGGRKTSGKKSTSRKSTSRTKARTSRTTSRVKAKKKSSVGKPARKTVNVRARRTTTTVSPQARKASRPTFKAKPIKRKPIVIARRRATKMVSSTAKIVKKQKQKPLTNFARSIGKQQPKNQTYSQNFNNQILGRAAKNTIAVRVNFPTGARVMYLGAPAIRAYERQGLKVSGVSMTMKDGKMYPTPPIRRIRDKTDRWSNNPPPLMTVPNRKQAKAPSPRGQNNIFKQHGNNPNSKVWDPLGDLMGMFDNSPQQAPASQYLPPQETFDYPRPVYDAFAQDQGFYETPQPVPNFNQQIQTDTFDAKTEITKLLKNKYALYAGIAIAALIGIKIILR